MCFKIPCKKNRFSVLAGLLLVLLLSVASLDVLANQRSETDQALFWSIEKNGQAAGYLLGTIHSEDPRVLDFSEQFLDKLKQNNVFAMELVPDLPTLARLNEYMHYPPGETLQSVIGAERFEILTAALETYHLPSEFVNSMKPWAVMMTLSTPPPETGFFMDLSLSLRASGSGLKVVGLETLEQQLSFLQEMPMSMQLSLLDQAVADYGEVGKVHDQMVSAYLENDLVSLTALTDEQLQVVGAEASDYFMQKGIHERNRRMLDNLLTQLESQRVFAAVGALHLVGDQGLISLLRHHGFELRPMEMPFSSDSVPAVQ